MHLYIWMFTTINFLKKNSYSIAVLFHFFFSVVVVKRILYFSSFYLSFFFKYITLTKFGIVLFLSFFYYIFFEENKNNKLSEILWMKIFFSNWIRLEMCLTFVGFIYATKYIRWDFWEINIGKIKSIYYCFSIFMFCVF
jgi:hypothetical protein